MERSLRKFLRFIGLGVVLSVFIPIGIAIAYLPLSQKFKYFLRFWHNQKVSRFALQILGVKVSVAESSGIDPGGPRLVVCNHVSYLDALVLVSQLDAVFVTSKEVQGDPVLGLICKAAGTFFVERRNRSDLKREVQRIAEFLSEGYSVVFFPEGTSSSGSSLLPFKSSLFEAAFIADVSILPLSLHYKVVDGRFATAGLLRKIAYIDDDFFFRHLTELCGLKNIGVQLHLLEPIQPNVRLASGLRRSHVSREAYSRISNNLKPNRAFLG